VFSRKITQYILICCIVLTDWILSVSFFSAAQLSVIVQCGNMTIPPNEPGYRDAWKVTKEWKLSIPSTITAEGSVERSSFLILPG
jgi:hypothetical protein